MEWFSRKAMNRLGALFKQRIAVRVPKKVLQAYEGVSVAVREGSAAIRCVTFGLPLT